MPLPTGRWLLGMAALALLAPLSIWWPPAMVLLGVLDGLWILLLLVDWYLAPDASVLEVERQAPPAFSVDRPLAVHYRWRNLGRRPARIAVREEFPAPLSRGPTPVRRLELPAESVVVEEIQLTPHSRGRASGGSLWLQLTGPMGLARVAARLERPWTATVFPNLRTAALRALPTQAMRRREAGLRNVRRLGEGRLFETLREWVPGDDTRAIDWKATARRGKVMARQYEDERRQQVLIVIDAGRLLTAEIDGRARLEAVIDAALHLAYAAVERDDNVGLMVFAEKVQRFIAPGRGRRTLRAILEALATIEGQLVEPNYPEAFAFLAARNRKRALTVLFTDVIDPSASEALVGQVGSLRPRHLPLAVTLRDPSLERLATSRPTTVTAAFERAAAESLLQSREEALAEMRGRGVLVLDVLPGSASEAVVDQYNRLKRRGVL